MDQYFYKVVKLSKRFCYSDLLLFSLHTSHISIQRAFNYLIPFRIYKYTKLQKCTARLISTGETLKYKFSAIVTLEMVLEDLSNFTKTTWLETVKNRSAQLSKITFGCACNG